MKVAISSEESIGPIFINWNMSCSLDFSSYRDLLHTHSEEIFSRDALLAVGQRILSLSATSFMIRFLGGEPTLQPYFADLVHMLCNQDVRVIVITDARRRPAYFQHLVSNIPAYHLEVHIVSDATASSEHLRNIIECVLGAGQYCRVSLTHASDHTENGKALYTALHALQKELPFAWDGVLATDDSPPIWTVEPSANHVWFTPRSPFVSLQGIFLKDASWANSVAELAVSPIETEKSSAFKLPAALQWLAGENLVAPEMLEKDTYAAIALALRRSGLFDTDWYLKQYPDVASSGIDPVLHYVIHGSTEGRDPAPWFSSAYYLEQYPDVLSANLNPFYHYIFCGYGEHREPHRPNAESVRMSALAEELKKKQQFAEAAEYYAQAITAAESPEPVPDWFVAQGQCHMALRQWEKAEVSFRSARQLHPADATVHAALAESLQRQGKWWQEIDAYEHALALDDSKAAWWFELAKAQEIMERWSASSEAYERAIVLDDQWAEWHYRLGYVRERNSQHRLAKDAYAQAIARDTTLQAKEYGIGVFHAQRAYWPEAAHAFEALACKQLTHAGLQAKLAVAYHRCYEFEKAAAANLNVLALTSPLSKKDDKLRLDAFYRLGIVLERLGRLNEAAQAYACALEFKYDAYRCYRHGFVLAQSGKYEQACIAYLRLGQDFDPVMVQLKDKSESAPIDTLNPTEQVTESSLAISAVASMARMTAEHYTTQVIEDATDPQLHFLRGFWLEQSGDMEAAAGAFTASAARQSEHNPTVWYRLGRALYTCGRFAEACDAFANIQILRQPYWVDRTFYNRNIWFKRRADYLEYCEHLPIAEKTVLYESMHGNAVGDNPQALFLHMLHDPAYAGWTHVWSLENLELIPDGLKKLPNVIFVRYESDGFLRYLATAKICINDTTFPEYFSRRPEQLYLNTWHGTPMKFMGKDNKSYLLDYHNVMRNFLHCTHLIHPNKYTEDIMMSRYNIKSIFKGISIDTGYPRIDCTLTSTENKKEKLRKYLGIQEGKKIILYAPTWRGTIINEKNVDISIDFINDVLRTCIATTEYAVIFRAHQALERYWNNSPDCRIAPQSIPTNELLAITDVLITDYSSIVFDFMALGRPIIFYCHDLEAYSATRGLYISPMELPGMFCSTPDELENALIALESWELDETYRLAQKKFCPYDDGKATQRAINLLQAHPEHQQSNKKNILFYVDFLKNGIGMAALALCNVLANQNTYNIYIMVNLSLTDKNTDIIDMMKQLDKKCFIIPIKRVMNETIEEHHSLERYKSKKQILNDKYYNLIHKIYNREFMRLFYDTQFDSIIDFTGYAAHQTELFAFSDHSKLKIIYLHSNMLMEKKNRFPYLQRIFNVYCHFDKIVSVSSSVNSINKENLSQQFSIPEENFISIPNIQRPEYVQIMAKEVLDSDDMAFFETGYKVFINVSRLSPEKNQELLLKAFASIHSAYPKTRLLIVGQGPLEDNLRDLIQNLQLEDAAFLVGFRDNPYSLLEHADCFVLSSRYEGQPTVIFEALAINKPIIATDIPMSREVLADGKYGLLTEATIEALAAGMEVFLRGEIPAPQFDFDKYQQQALQAFEELLVPQETEQKKPEFTLLSKEEIESSLQEIKIFDMTTLELYKNILCSACVQQMYTFSLARQLYTKNVDESALYKIISFLLDNIDFIFNSAIDIETKFKGTFLIIERYISKISHDKQYKYMKIIYNFFDTKI